MSGLPFSFRCTLRQVKVQGVVTALNRENIFSLRTPGPCQVVQQAERPRRYSQRCSALAPPCRPPASFWQPAPAPARSAWGPPHTRRGSGERGAGRCWPNGQAREPMRSWKLRGAWFRPGSAPGSVPLGGTFLRRVPGC